MSRHEASADQRDIQAALGGDEEAFARIVHRYEGEIARQMWHFTRDSDLLDDLVAEVFVSAYIGLAGYRGDAPFEHWLRRIATRAGYSHWKRESRERKRREAIEEWRAEIPTATVDSSPSAAAEYLHGLLARLGPKDRLVLTLQYFEDCSNQEIADRTGWTRAAVKVRSFRARRKLQAMLEEIGFGRKENERSAAESG